MQVPTLISRKYPGTKQIADRQDPYLPDKVSKPGVRVLNHLSGFLLVAGFYSADGRMDRFDISDYSCL